MKEWLLKCMLKSGKNEKEREEKQIIERTLSLPFLYGFDLVMMLFELIYNTKSGYYGIANKSGLEVRNAARK